MYAGGDPAAFASKYPSPVTKIVSFSLHASNFYSPAHYRMLVLVVEIRPYLNGE